MASRPLQGAAVGGRPKDALQIRERRFGDVDQITELLSGSPEIDIFAAERIVTALDKQARTVAGNPRLRPADCAAVTKALEKALESNRALFLLGDPAPALRFDAILDAYARTDVQFYPRELFRARLIQAEVRFLLNDSAGARQAIGHFLDNPYALEGGFDDLLTLFRFDCRLRATTQSAEEVGRQAMLYVIALIQLRLRLRALWRALGALSPFIGLGVAPPREDGRLRGWLHGACRGGLRARRGAGWLALPLQAALATFFATLAFICLLAIRFARRAPLLRASGPSEVLATRAMGGIGDLLMMTPGLRALAKRRGRAVRLAIPRKFFAVFANNPHVQLNDIDVMPLDASGRNLWRNLTICPAAAYESRRRPWVKRSRVQLFAAGLGVRRGELDRWGWNVELFLDAQQQESAGAFIRGKGLGSRPVVGVQPYSRDSYKDHPGILAFIEDLARDYDVLVFHHAEAGLPAGPGIATTAGLALSQSLALVSRVSAMITCDSAFLHAAAAFDVPVFAMFGPTDGALFTRHHRHAVVYQNKAAFPCSPCWRNEDIACNVTGRLGPSPCVATLNFAPIRDALDKTLAASPTAAARSLQRATA